MYIANFTLVLGYLYRNGLTAGTTYRGRLASLERATKKHSKRVKEKQKESRT
jgi:hypothetical protein